MQAQDMGAFDVNEEDMFYYCICLI